MARTTQTAWSKQKRTWVFYYQTERSGEKIVIGTMDCKQPERTALRKLQRTYWNMPNVVGTGYTSDLNEPMLVWPQSKLPMTNAMLDEIIWQCIYEKLNKLFKTLQP